MFALAGEKLANAYTQKKFAVLFCFLFLQDTAAVRFVQFVSSCSNAKSLQ